HRADGVFHPGCDLQGDHFHNPCVTHRGLLPVAATAATGHPHGSGQRASPRSSPHPPPPPTHQPGHRTGPPPTTRRLPHRAATPGTRSAPAGCANAACGGSPPTSPSSQSPSKRGVGVRLPRRRCVHRRRLSPLGGCHSPGTSSITTRARTGTQSSHPTALKLSSYSEYRHSERSLGCFSRNRDRCFSHHEPSRPSNSAWAASKATTTATSSVAA